MNDGNTGKLVFLKDRGKRSVLRFARRRTDAARRTITERNRPTDKETLWLSRAFFGVAAYVALTWLAIGTGLAELGTSTEARDWMWSLLLADIAITVLAVLGGYELASASSAAGFYVRFAAGALLTFGLMRIGHAARESFARDLVPIERLEVCAIVACLWVGMWTISYSLRLRAEH